MIIARAVEIAVRLTLSSILALLRLEMKLLILPPGQDATSIIPIAMENDTAGPSAHARRKVSSGSRTSWQSIPSSTDLGFLNTSTKMRGWMPRATPYITKARIMLIVFMPPALSVTTIESI